MPFDPRILDDPELKDDDELTFGKQKIKVADLRAYRAAQDQAVAERDAKYNDAATQYSQLATMANQYKAQLDEALAKAGRPETVDESKLLEVLAKRLLGDQKKSVLDQPGEYFQPVVDKLKKVDDIEKRFDEMTAAQKKATQDAFAWQLQKDMRRDFRAIKDWPKDMTFEKAIQMAQQNGYVDRADGYPDFDKLHETLTAPERQKREREEYESAAEKRGYEKAMQQASTVPLPGYGGGAGAPNMKSKFGGIDKIPDSDILNDPDIIATFTLPN
jgi:hypothetical protein